MKIVISPAKSLDFESPLPTKLYSQFGFQKQSLAIDKVLKKKTPKQLSDLMSISDKLSDLNWQRNQERNVSEITTENGRPSIFAFSGEVYVGLDAYSLSEEKINNLQDKLRILSGLYGLLQPLDLMQPYRLEMGTKLPVGKNKNLYEFWKTTITNELNSQLEKDELFVNLASNEYFDVVDVKKLKVPVVTPEFKDYKDGKLKMISFFAKKARGMMVRYIIDTNAQTIDDLKGFNYEGYAFDSNLSKGNTLVFTR
ncbi:peroxide stress protein YaaA [Flavobacterium sp.]|uniref:peroxide stress protein YaaA n=1 Tax=Flavobacterium sp. TaxID=239 RepID=UPI003BCF751F